MEEMWSVHKLTSGIDGNERYACMPQSHVLRSCVLSGRVCL